MHQEDFMQKADAAVQKRPLCRHIRKPAEKSYFLIELLENHRNFTGASPALTLECVID